MGIDNGILDEPRVDVETSPGHWVTSDTWPVSDNNQTAHVPQRRLADHRRAGSGTAAFVNSPSQSEAEAVAKGDNPNRLLYVTGSLADDVPDQRGSRPSS